MEGVVKYLIVSFLFIFNLGFGQHNSRTDSNRNDVLSIKPKISESLITIQQIQKESNSSSIFWVDPRIEMITLLQKLLRRKDPSRIGVELWLGGNPKTATKDPVISMV